MRRLIVGNVGQFENRAYTLHKKWAHRTIKKVFPQVGQTKLEYGWNCRIAMAVDHIPRFHLFDNAMVTVT
jgi:glycine/D-amino acid oxidase-like deaminating enzyme